MNPALQGRPFPELEARHRQAMADKADHAGGRWTGKQLLERIHATPPHLKPGERERG